jgi:hypothetical protein
MTAASVKSIRFLTEPVTFDTRSALGQHLDRDILHHVLRIGVSDDLRDDRAMRL